MGIDDYQNARKHINIAIGFLDVALDAHYVSLAISHNREGNYKEVIELLKLAIVENPQNQLAHFQLAVAADNYYKDREPAIALYENYMKLFKEQGDFYETVSVRLSDLKKEQHLGNN